MIKADFNDADYSTSINKITDKELEIIKPAIKELKRVKGKVEKFQELFEDEDKIDETLLDSLMSLDGYFPYAGDNEIHTIVDIQVFEGTIKTLF